MEPILSVKDLVVKFKVRKTSLNAIRNVSLDIYKGETLAIVGESGSGKSVLTKTFTGMLDTNGYITSGNISLKDNNKEIDIDKLFRTSLTSNQRTAFFKLCNAKITNFKKMILFIKNLDVKKVTAQIENNKKIITQLDEIYTSKPKQKVLVKKHELIKTNEDLEKYIKIANDKQLFKETIEKLIADIDVINHEQIQYFSNKKKISHIKEVIELIDSLLIAKQGKSRQDLIDQKILTLEKENQLYQKLAVETYHFNKLCKKSVNTLFVQELKNLLKIANNNDDLKKLKADLINEINFHKTKNATTLLRKIRGGIISTIFQDPMTSLNPLLSVGYQIKESIILHQHVSGAEAKKKAIELLKKVGIPNAAKRYHDIPGKYSGGMRQRVVIAIALSSNPKILIADEPTTALDVTVQAQILKLIKDLQTELKLTVIFITHDLGVVANIADRVAIMYSGQIVEYGKVDEIFFDSRHPYTWALLQSLPQLSQKGEELFAIPGSPPSLTTDIVGDPFAPRNKYALAIDYIKEPPFFKVTDTHYAKTWLLDKRSPKVKRPVILDSISKLTSFVGEKVHE